LHDIVLLFRYSESNTNQTEESKMNLEEKKAQALKNYKEKRDAYMETISRENWIAFCDAKRVCRLMGVRI